ncbi:hypothetical protein [Streptomyces silvisoli]|uniref:Uncharacterized protein n=1 Tax=Streptomyces silvisoli TaxID=3034235 RepID=A0ABT5ZPP8_9ACTN|nr:hypothetical protein [Streptomyces silvisoli]MDF3291807.1 hypothetical protein [Streptomyces silvisoli]
MVLDLSEAERELGYRPVTRVLRIAPGHRRVDRGAPGGRGWRVVSGGPTEILPGHELFDNPSEDRWLRGFLRGWPVNGSRARAT